MRGMRMLRSTGKTGVFLVDRRNRCCGRQAKTPIILIMNEETGLGFDEVGMKTGRKLWLWATHGFPGLWRCTG